MQKGLMSLDLKRMMPQAWELRCRDSGLGLSAESLPTAFLWAPCYNLILLEYAPKDLFSSF